MKNNVVLDTEKNIGIQTFFTSFKGVGGRLRILPEDFVVKEISSYPPEKENGKFTIADVTATNWETNLLIRELSKRLYISRKRIGFAGTKDKRAKTSQLMSFYNVTLEDLSKVNIKDVVIENVYCSDRPIKIGDLFGNSFIVIVRNIEKDISHKQIQNIASSIVNIGGFPNFYGIQRFGIIRPITHVVGECIVRGDFEKAVMTYVANPIEGENEESFMIRDQLEKTHDFAKALKCYPSYLNFEKAILNKLVTNPEDFVGALKELPQNLLTMFVYAYQSFLFNKMLSERIKNNLPLNKAVLGDVVLPVRRGVIDKNEIKVKENNIEKVNRQIPKGKAVVSSLLVGCDSKFSDGAMGEIEHNIVEKEKIDLRDFIIPDIPFVSSTGSRRSLLAYVKNFDFELINDNLNDDKLALILKFDLEKGCYATCLLREFMKTDDIRKY